MRLIWIILCLLSCGPTFAAEPFARVLIEDAVGIVPGQQVHVFVEVFVPDFFTSPPQYPLFELPDALVTLSSDRAQNLVQTADGVQYSGIRRGYTVVPQKAGSFSLPAIDIEVGFSLNGAAVKADVSVALPSFEVAPFANEQAGSFTARDLSISQSFDPDPATLKAGEALVRTVVVFASDTQAMLIPPVDFPDPVGIVQYRKPPVLGDNVDRRGIGRTVETGSTRTETVVYTTSKAGQFIIPPLSYRWFDLDGKTVSTAVLPAVNVMVAETRAGERIRPNLEEQVPTTGSSTHWWLAITLACAAGIVTVGISMWKLQPNLRAAVNRLQASIRKSPRYRLRALRTVINGASEMEIYCALQACSEGLGHKSLAAWAEAERNRGLSEQLLILESRLFGMSSEKLNREALSRTITLPKRKRTQTQESALPQLNPG